MSNRNALPHGGPATRNEKRAERAFRVLLAYGIEGDEEEAVTDLLTDLRHLSNQYGWTLDELVERSSRHYEFEVMEADAEARATGDPVDWDRVHDGTASEDDWQRWSE